jgi:hypothetical protein
MDQNGNINDLGKQYIGEEPLAGGAVSNGDTLPRNIKRTMAISFALTIMVSFY